MRSAGARVTSWSSNRMLPPRLPIRLEMARISVVLPAPLAPRMATTSPFSTASDTPFSASIWP